MSRAVRRVVIVGVVLAGVLLGTAVTPALAGGDPGGGASSTQSGLAVSIHYRGTTRTGAVSEVVYERWKNALASAGQAICGTPQAPDLLYVFPNSVSNAYPWFCVPATTPDPPTPQEILRLIPWPKPVISVSPTPDGLTGLNTWLWYAGPTTRRVSASLHGYAVTASAELGDYVWGTGDGWRTTTETAGSSQRPSATHAYNRKGSYTLSLTQTWYPSFVIGGGVWGTISGPLEPQTFTGVRPYPVAEVRSVLVHNS